MFIKKLKKTYSSSQPILIEDIFLLFPRFSRAYIFRLIKKAEENGELVKYSRGVYCLPKKTIFGEVTLSPFVVAESKYISNKHEVYGVYSGLTLLNQFEVTSQVPNNLEIITNNEATRKRDVCINGKKFILRKSRFEITKDNFCYYVVLQLFSELGINTKLENMAKQRVEEFIEKNDINIEKLIDYSMYFPAQVLKKLIGSGVLYGALQKQSTFY